MYDLGTKLTSKYRMVTFKTNSVSLQTSHSLIEQVLASRRNTRYIVLLPFDGCIYVFKYLFNGIGNFSANAIPRDKCDLEPE